ncbi:MAG: hypothetical protein WA152_04210 [Microgenomates group bacterium]
MINHLLIYLFSFIGIWIGSGIAIKSVQRISRTLKVSSFVVSFILLGFFTSISELSVGVNSIIENEPEIYVGNLIGASIVLFMLIVPLLAIVGKSIRISPEFQGFNLPASLVVVALPVMLTLDGTIGKFDSIVCVSLFIFLIISIQAKKGLFDNLANFETDKSVKFGKEILRIIFGIVVIFIASRFVVEQTNYFAEILNVSPFLISLLVISIGTNVPELSLVIRAAFMKNNQVAFGDYVGSAAFNTFLIGILSLAYKKPIILSNSYVTSLLFLVVGLFIFYLFARSKNTVSRIEGLFLLSIYILFLYVEIMGHKSLMFWI